MYYPLGTYCPVCGLNQHEEVVRLAGEICGCCGTQYTGSFEKEGVLRLRRKWERDGYPWYRAQYRPRQWDVSAQLAQIPDAYHAG